jgi:hypothetical protein
MAEGFEQLDDAALRGFVQGAANEQGLRFESEPQADRWRVRLLTPDESFGEVTRWEVTAPTEREALEALAAELARQA